MQDETRVEVLAREVLAREVLAAIVDNSSAWAAKHIRQGMGDDGTDALSICVRDAIAAMLAFAAPPAGEREERVGKYGCLRESLDRDIERTGTLESFVIRAGLLRDILDDLDALAAIKVGDSHLNEATPSLPHQADREAIAREVEAAIPEPGNERHLHGAYTAGLREAARIIRVPSAGRNGSGA